MNKQELALQYFPDATSATAVRHLTRWIARCHPLVEALTGTGYQSRNRTFTWKQVTLIPLHTSKRCDGQTKSVQRTS